MTNNLVYLTKGAGEESSKHREEAVLTLDKIISERKIIGGTGYI